MFCLSAFLSIREFNPLMLLSMVSCLYPLFFIFSTCLSLYIWNVASFEFVRLMIPWPVPGGWADEACKYCWVLVGLIWVLISRMPSLANLSPLYKHKSRNVISVVENSAVKLMRSCKPLMLLMNCSRLSFVSVHTRNISSIYLFQCVGEGFASEGIFEHISKRNSLLCHNCPTHLGHKCPTH